MLSPPTRPIVAGVFHYTPRVLGVKDLDCSFFSVTDTKNHFLVRNGLENKTDLEKYQTSIEHFTKFLPPLESLKS